MGNNPMIARHRYAVGRKGDTEVGESVLPHLAVLLVARGADRVLLPTPSELEREELEQAIRTVPIERRRLLRPIDTDGALLTQVHEYLSPLAEQADKWPEDAFVTFCADFLYEAVLGHRHRASVASSDVQVVREFVPLVDPSAFRGEARFRLAELVRLICSYEPAAVDQGAVATDVPRKTETALRLMQAAEFRGLVAASGGVGYLKYPLKALRELRYRFEALITSPEVGGTLELAATAVDAAAGGSFANIAARGFGLVGTTSAFSSPFIDLGQAEYSLYRATIDEADASPPPGVAMAFQCGTRHTWLNAGEETAWEDAASAVSHRVDSHQKALRAASRFV